MAAEKNRAKRHKHNLNPLRAGLVGSMPKLDRYRYCGHSFLMDLHHNDWQDADYILKFFGKKAGTAREHYREFVAKGIKAGRRPDLMRGGLIRKAGGWTALNAYQQQKEHRKGDERILGKVRGIKSGLTADGFFKPDGYAAGFKADGRL